MKSAHAMLNFKKHTEVFAVLIITEKMYMRKKFKRTLCLRVLIMVETTGDFPLFYKCIVIFCCFLHLTIKN